MARQTVYEWLVETIEDGDIVGVSHTESRAQAERWVAGQSGTYTIGLTRDVWDDHGLADRCWAYVQDDGTLPAYFSDSGGHETGYKVPVRFHREKKA